jgi:hypothetical protein
MSTPPTQRTKSATTSAPAKSTATGAPAKSAATTTSAPAKQAAVAHTNATTAPAKATKATKKSAPAPTTMPEPTVEPAAAGQKTPTVLTFNIEPIAPPAARPKVASEPEPRPEREPEPRPEREPEREPEPRPEPTTDSLVRGLRRYPGYAPELLALAAVEHLGDEAGRYASWVRDTYPAATADGLARLATQRFLRLARNEGAAAGVAGPFTLLLEASGLVWLQARLVLHLAAAYGHDPSERARAGELLLLLRVHPIVATAQTAVDAVKDTAAPGILTSRLAAPAGRALGAAALRAGLGRLAARLVPGGGAVVGAVTSMRSTEKLAVRATRFYRTRQKPI